MVRPVRVLPLLAVLILAGLALVAPGPAAARTWPPGAPFKVVVVERMSDATFNLLARRGAVGLFRPSYGPTTNRRRALAQLVRGAEVNARLGGVPSGKPLINANKAAVFHDCRMCIVVKLPPRGWPFANHRLYRIAVIGRGFHGLLTSSTTRMSWTPSSAPVAHLDRLDAQIHDEDRLKYAGIFIAAALAILLALLGWRAARTAIPAALLVSLALGAFHITNEVVIVAVFTTVSALGALWLARVCREDLALLGLIVFVLLAYLAVFVKRPEWAAVTPLGPDQNLRFWGIGDQIGTLLFAPLLMGAVIARQRLGWIGFTVFSLFGLFVMTDNRLGANGGGAIGLGLALAVLAARLSRRGLPAFVGALTATAAIVLAIVHHGLASPGPNHLRSAFGSGIGGFLDVALNRVPLVYAPAVHEWPLTLPLAVLMVASGVLAFHVTRSRAARDLLLALATGVIASLFINDATGFMLAGGIACASAVARFAPSGAPIRLPVLSRLLRPGREAARGYLP
jgi:hypothetical protein